MSMRLNFDQMLTKEKSKRTRKPQGHEESDIQISCVKWFSLQYPRYAIFSVPNGGGRNRKEMYFLKKEGLTPGVADLVICADNGRVLFVEMKTSKGKQSPNQKEFESKVSELGFKYIICRSTDDFIEKVKLWVNEIKWK